MAGLVFSFYFTFRRDLSSRWSVQLRFVSSSEVKSDQWRRHRQLSAHVGRLETFGQVEAQGEVQGGMQFGFVLEKLVELHFGP